MLGASAKGKATSYTDYYKNNSYGPTKLEDELEKRDENLDDIRKKAIQRRLKRKKVGL